MKGVDKSPRSAYSLELQFISIFLITNGTSCRIFMQNIREEAVFSIETGEILQGNLPSSKTKLVAAWIEIHREDLMANWELAVNGLPPLPIDPLR